MVRVLSGTLSIVLIRNHARIILLLYYFTSLHCFWIFSYALFLFCVSFFSLRQFHLIEITLTFINHLHLWVCFLFLHLQCTGSQYVECCTVLFVSSSYLADLCVVFFLYLTRLFKSFVLFGCFMFVDRLLLISKILAHLFLFSLFCLIIFGQSLLDFDLFFLLFLVFCFLQFAFSIFISQFNKSDKLLVYQSIRFRVGRLSVHIGSLTKRTMKQ